MTKLPCANCGKKPRKRKITYGIFKFKELYCPNGCFTTRGDYGWLSSDDAVIREWNKIQEERKKQ